MQEWRRGKVMVRSRMYLSIYLFTLKMKFSLQNVNFRIIQGYLISVGKFDLYISLCILLYYLVFSNWREEKYIGFKCHYHVGEQAEWSLIIKYWESNLKFLHNYELVYFNHEFNDEEYKCEKIVLSQRLIYRSFNI